MERMKLQKVLVSCQDELCVITQGEIRELVVFRIPPRHAAAVGC